MKKIRNRKTMSFLLAAALLLSTAVVPAFAEETAGTAVDQVSSASVTASAGRGRQGNMPQQPGNRQDGRQPQNGQQPQAAPAGNGNRNNGQRPALPDGVTEPKQDENGQPPALPDGETPAQDQNGQPPALPDGETQSQDQNGQPPALPDGETQSQDQNGQPPARPVTVQTGNRSGLKMRTDPSQKSKVMGTFKNGTEVEILEVGDEWVKVRVGDKTGYMMIQFLEGDIQAAAESAESTEAAETAESSGSVDTAAVEDA